LTLDDVFLLATRIARRQNFLTLVIHNHFGALNFQLWWGFGAAANMARLRESMDVAMPRTNGIAVASVLKEMMPNVRIVLFTMYSEAVAKAFPHEGLAVDAVIDKADGVSRLADCVQGLLRS
jgi:hypothetical protein